jgi:GNAT superfamily N-acetyltransferase
MAALRQTRDLLAAYPKPLILEDGLAVEVRPLRREDEARLVAFFRSIPASDRWWLREDVGDAAVVHQWVSGLDYERVLPLVAFVGDEIVADATLHRRGFGARAHLAEVRVVVAPAYRGRGLAYALIGELVEIATAAGIERVEAEIVGGAQLAALEAVEMLGFEQVAVLADHLRGPDGRRHDLILLVLQLTD